MIVTTLVKKKPTTSTSRCFSFTIRGYGHHGTNKVADLRQSLRRIFLATRVECTRSTGRVVDLGRGGMTENTPRGFKRTGDPFKQLHVRAPEKLVYGYANKAM